MPTTEAPVKERYYSPKEAAERYQVGTQVVLDAIAAGRLEAQKLSARTFRISRAALERWGREQ
jgi:excisionase family DNA binding protein